MSTDQKNAGVNLDELFFYFDSQKKDGLDHGVVGRRSSKVIELRDKLLALSDTDFDVAVKTIQTLVESHQKTKDDEPSKTSLQHQQGKKLYETITAKNHVNRADEVSKV